MSASARRLAADGKRPGLIPLSFQPKLLSTLRKYSRSDFLHDAAAGVIVGVVALPLCIAFAIASGVPPEKGLITGIVAGFFVSALGGSRVQIGGPAGAFVVIVAAVVEHYGMNGLVISTLMAGAILIIMGVIGLGSVIKFVPYPVVAGFTSGIAVIIFTTQVRDFFGFTIPDLPSGFIEKWAVFAETLPALNPYAVLIAGGTLLLLLYWPRISRRVPGSLAAVILSSVVVYAFDLPVDTIHSRFGAIPSGLPEPGIDAITWDTIRGLIQPATTIALLVAIESLLSAVVADGMIGGRHRSNMELIGQGAANIASALFGGIPATGAIARTATNVRNGGRTPVAGIVHAATLLAIMLFFGQWASHIPLACLAAILIVVAYNMSEWRNVVALLKSPKSDIAVMLTTLGLTVLIDLTVAIEVGMVLAAFLFMKRMVGVTAVSQITRDEGEEGETEPAPPEPEQSFPDGVQVYEINGPLFFGTVYAFKDAISIVATPPRVRVLRMRHVNMIDASGLRALEEVYRASQKQGTQLLLSGVHAQPFTALMKSGLLSKFGEENVLADFDDALRRAREILGNESANLRSGWQRPAI